jgi:hypothetical protein
MDPVPKIELPLQRHCYAVRGPIEVAGDLPLKIQVWFPEDRAWCYGSDTDIYWAFIAGNQECIAELIDSPELETYPVSTDDEVHFGSDRINDPEGKIEPRY